MTLLAILIALILALAGLLFQRHRRQAAERSLMESNARMAAASDAASLGMWVWDLREKRIWISDRCKLLFGYAANEKIGLEQIRARVHPEDTARVDAVLKEALVGDGPHMIEHRVELPDGGLRWLATSGRVERAPDGTRTHLVGISVDVTERKQTESLAREVSGRLITAQEDERKRIARDLHDDLNQRLAMLSVQLELLGQKITADPAHSQVDEIGLHVKKLSSDVHQLSYGLHPAKLDQLGLIAAARTLCRDLSKQSGVQIEFTHTDIRRDIDSVLALSMYRVLQEALHNAVRHSGAPIVRVDLRANDYEIRLTVSDTGRGFDRAQAARRGRLGFISMRERMYQVDGTFTLDSSPDNGTRVEAYAPMKLAPPES